MGFVENYDLNHLQISTFDIGLYATYGKFLWHTHTTHEKKDLTSKDLSHLGGERSKNRL